jgi:hypothetical protein
MLARSLTYVILAAATLSLGACQMPQRGADTAATRNPHATGPSLGYLEHRGQRHALRDLLDPAYRQASDDPVARTFDVADYWAATPVLSADVDRPQDQRPHSPAAHRETTIIGPERRNAR